MHSFINFLKKNKLYTAINITGLTVSMAFVLLLACYVTKQLRTDSFQQNADRIYLVASERQYESAYYLQTYLRQRYPEIEKTASPPWRYIPGTIWCSGRSASRTRRSSTCSRSG